MWTYTRLHGITSQKRVIVVFIPLTASKNWGILPLHIFVANMNTEGKVVLGLILSFGFAVHMLTVTNNHSSWYDYKFVEPLTTISNTCTNDVVSEVCVYMKYIIPDILCHVKEHLFWTNFAENSYTPLRRWNELCTQRSTCADIYKRKDP
jgi:hypothetical protein